MIENDNETIITIFKIKLNKCIINSIFDQTSTSIIKYFLQNLKIQPSTSVWNKEKKDKSHP